MAAPQSVGSSLPLNGSWALLATVAAAKNAVIQVVSPGDQCEYALATAAADLTGLAGHILSQNRAPNGKELTAPASGICARNLGGRVQTVATKIMLTVTL